MMIILDMPVATTTLVTAMVIIAVSDISIVVVGGHARAPASFGKALAISLDTARVVAEGGLRLLRQFDRTCAGDQWARVAESKRIAVGWLKMGVEATAAVVPVDILFWRLMTPKS